MNLRLELMTKSILLNVIELSVIISDFKSTSSVKLKESKHLFSVFSCKYKVNMSEKKIVGMNFKMWGQCMQNIV